MPNPILAVVGGSASGKSTVVKSLKKVIPCQSVILPFDRYYLDLSHLSHDERAKTNFDHPNAIDITLYVEHLIALSEGKSVIAPIYDFATHTRQGNVSIQPQPLIITEGILLLAIGSIREIIDFSVFLDVPEEIRLARKIHRDVTERSRMEAYAREQFYSTVKPIHDELVIPSMQYADLVLDGTLPTERIVEQIMLKTPHFTDK